MSTLKDTDRQAVLDGRQESETETDCLRRYAREHLAAKRQQIIYFQEILAQYQSLPELSLSGLASQAEQFKQTAALLTCPVLRAELLEQMTRPEVGETIEARFMHAVKDCEAQRRTLLFAVIDESSQRNSYDVLLKRIENLEHLPEQIQALTQAHVVANAFATAVDRVVRKQAHSPCSLEYQLVWQQLELESRVHNRKDLELALTRRLMQPLADAAQQQGQRFAETLLDHVSGMTKAEFIEDLNHLKGQADSLVTQLEDAIDENHVLARRKREAIVEVLQRDEVFRGLSSEPRDFKQNIQAIVTDTVRRRHAQLKQAVTTRVQGLIERYQVLLMEVEQGGPDTQIERLFGELASVIGDMRHCAGDYQQGSVEYHLVFTQLSTLTSSRATSAEQCIEALQQQATQAIENKRQQLGYFHQLSDFCSNLEQYSLSGLAWVRVQVGELSLKLTDRVLQQALKAQLGRGVTWTQRLNDCESTRKTELTQALETSKQESGYNALEASIKASQNLAEQKALAMKAPNIANRCSGQMRSSIVKYRGVPNASAAHQADYAFVGGLLDNNNIQDDVSMLTAFTDGVLHLLTSVVVGQGDAYARALVNLIGKIQLATDFKVLEGVQRRLYDHWDKLEDDINDDHELSLEKQEAVAAVLNPNAELSVGDGAFKQAIWQYIDDLLKARKAQLKQAVEQAGNPLVQAYQAALTALAQADSATPLTPRETQLNDTCETLITWFEQYTQGTDEYDLALSLLKSLKDVDEEAIINTPPGNKASIIKTLREYTATVIRDKQAQRKLYGELSLHVDMLRRQGLSGLQEARNFVKANLEALTDPALRADLAKKLGCCLDSQIKKEILARIKVAKTQREQALTQAMQGGAAAQRYREHRQAVDSLEGLVQQQTLYEEATTKADNFAQAIDVVVIRDGVAVDELEYQFVRTQLKLDASVVDVSSLAQALTDQLQQQLQGVVQGQGQTFAAQLLRLVKTMRKARTLADLAGLEYRIMEHHATLEDEVDDQQPLAQAKRVAVVRALKKDKAFSALNAQVTVKAPLRAILHDLIDERRAQLHKKVEKAGFTHISAFQTEQKNIQEGRLTLKIDDVEQRFSRAVAGINAWLQTYEPAPDEYQVAVNVLVRELQHNGVSLVEPVKDNGRDEIVRVLREYAETQVAWKREQRALFREVLALREELPQVGLTRIEEIGQRLEQIMPSLEDQSLVEQLQSYCEDTAYADWMAYFRSLPEDYSEQRRQALHVAVLQQEGDFAGLLTEIGRSSDLDAQQTLHQRATAMATTRAAQIHSQVRLDVAGQADRLEYTELRRRLVGAPNTVVDQASLQDYFEERLLVPLRVRVRQQGTIFSNELRRLVEAMRNAPTIEALEATQRQAQQKLNELEEAVNADHPLSATKRAAIAPILQAGGLFALGGADAQFKQNIARRIGVLRTERETQLLAQVQASGQPHVNSYRRALDALVRADQHQDLNALGRNLTQAIGDIRQWLGGYVEGSAEDNRAIAMLQALQNRARTPIIGNQPGNRVAVIQALQAHAQNELAWKQQQRGYFNDLMDLHGRLDRMGLSELAQASTTATRLINQLDDPVLLQALADELDLENTAQAGLIDEFNRTIREYEGQRREALKHTYDQSAIGSGYGALEQRIDGSARLDDQQILFRDTTAVSQHRSNLVAAGVRQFNGVPDPLEYAHLRTYANLPNTVQNQASLQNHFQAQLRANLAMRVTNQGQTFANDLIVQLDSIRNAASIGDLRTALTQALRLHRDLEDAIDADHQLSGIKRRIIMRALNAEPHAFSLTDTAGVFKAGVLARIHAIAAENITRLAQPSQRELDQLNDVVTPIVARVRPWSDELPEAEFAAFVRSQQAVERELAAVVPNIQALLDRVNARQVEVGALPAPANGLQDFVNLQRDVRALQTQIQGHRTHMREQRRAGLIHYYASKVRELVEMTLPRHLRLQDHYQVQQGLVDLMLALDINLRREFMRALNDEFRHSSQWTFIEPILANEPALLQQCINTNIMRIHLQKMEDFAKYKPLVFGQQHATKLFGGSPACHGHYGQTLFGNKGLPSSGSHVTGTGCGVVLKAPAVSFEVKSYSGATFHCSTNNSGQVKAELALAVKQGLTREQKVQTMIDMLINVVSKAPKVIHVEGDAVQVAAATIFLQKLQQHLQNYPQAFPRTLERDEGYCFDHVNIKNFSGTETSAREHAEIETMVDNIMQGWCEAKGLAPGADPLLTLRTETPDDDHSASNFLGALRDNLLAQDCMRRVRRSPRDNLDLSSKDLPLEPLAAQRFVGMRRG